MKVRENGNRVSFNRVNLHGFGEKERMRKRKNRRETLPPLGGRRGGGGGWRATKSQRKTNEQTFLPLSQILVTVGRNCEYRISLGSRPALWRIPPGGIGSSRAKSNGKTWGEELTGKVEAGSGVGERDSEH